ncbi:MAG: HD domain-containing protein [Desulfovibrio sp.]|nr:HD domain-containing protein [Desulfovibrio sp.]
MRQDTDISWHEQWFAAYATRERAKARGDATPLDLKIRHTQRVLDNARAVITEETFMPDTARACLLAALYHDIARFEQYLRYGTFKDRESCNHGLLGVKILKGEKCLAREKDTVRGAALAAVGLHNRFALPRGLPENVGLAAWVVRDADKLDILRIMDEHLSGPMPYCPTVVLSLPDNADICSRTVIEAALAGRVAAYADLRSVNDFRLLLGTWFFDLRFPASRNRFILDGHARRLLAALPDIPPYGQAKNFLLTLFEGQGARLKQDGIQPPPPGSTRQRELS